MEPERTEFKSPKPGPSGILRETGQRTPQSLRKRVSFFHCDKPLESTPVVDKSSPSDTSEYRPSRKSELFNTAFLSDSQNDLGPMIEVLEEQDDDTTKVDELNMNLDVIKNLGSLKIDDVLSPIRSPMTNADISPELFQTPNKRFRPSHVGRTGDLCTPSPNGNRERQSSNQRRRLSLLNRTIDLCTPSPKRNQAGSPMATKTTPLGVSNTSPLPLFPSPKRTKVSKGVLPMEVPVANVQSFSEMKKEGIPNEKKYVVAKEGERETPRRHGRIRRPPVWMRDYVQDYESEESHLE